MMHATCMPLMTVKAAFQPVISGAHMMIQPQTVSRIKPIRQWEKDGYSMYVPDMHKESTYTYVVNPSYSFIAGASKCTIQVSLALKCIEVEFYSTV